MPDKNGSATTDANKPTSNQEFAIQQIYVKDLSYEAPNTPHVFREEWKPEISIDINLDSAKLDENIYEVVLRLTITAKKADKSIFICEVKQAGIFALKGFSDSEMEQILKVLCPGILYPYAREEISSRVAKGGFPAIYLAPVNFESLYMQHKAQNSPQPDTKDGKIITH